LVLLYYIYIESKTTPAQQIYKDATNTPNDEMVYIDTQERDSSEINTEGTFNIGKFNYNDSHLPNV